MTTPGGATTPALNYTYLTTVPTAVSINPTSGPDTGGQTVTITGTNFIAGSTSVTIGGNTITAANVTVTAPTTLTFSTPAHVAGLVGVTVTTPGGATTPALDYTYLATVPTAVSINPTSGPDTGGQTVTITGTNFVAGSTSVTIGGNTVAAANVTVTAPTTLTFSTPAHTASLVGVTVTTPGGATTPALDYTYVTSPPAPPPPVITAPTDGSTTTDTTPSVSGTGVPGDTVTVVEGSTTICTELVDNSSNWVCVSTLLAVGAHTIVATQDPPVVVSGPSNIVHFTIVPLPPVILSPVNGSTISDPTPPLGGTGGAGYTIAVTVDGSPACSTMADANGDWVCESRALANGHHVALATQTINGVTSGPSADDGFTRQGAVPTHLASTGVSATYLIMLGLLLLQGGVLMLVALAAIRRGPAMKKQIRSMTVTLAAAAVAATTLTFSATNADAGTVTTFTLTGSALSISAPATASLGTGSAGTTLSASLGTVTVTDRADLWWRRGSLPPRRPRSPPAPRRRPRRSPPRMCHTHLASPPPKPDSASSCYPVS